MGVKETLLNLLGRFPKSPILENIFLYIYCLARPLTPNWASKYIPKTCCQMLEMQVLLLHISRSYAMLVWESFRCSDRQLTTC